MCNHSLVPYSCSTFRHSDFYTMKLLVALIIFPLFITTSLQDICGDSLVGTGLIVGGSTIKRGQWPFIVALFRSKTEKYFCGGTIISMKHIITAAHCISPKHSIKPVTLFTLEDTTSAEKMRANRLSLKLM